MKIMDGLVLTEVADDFVVVPMGKAAEKLRGLIRMNKTGRDVWQGISDGLTVEQIADSLLEKYDGVTKEEALVSVQKSIDKLVAENIVFPD